MWLLRTSCCNGSADGLRFKLAKVSALLTIATAAAAATIRGQTRPRGVAIRTGWLSASVPASARLARMRALRTSGARYRVSAPFTCEDVSTRRRCAAAQSWQLFRCDSTSAASSTGNSPSMNGPRFSRQSAQVMSARLPGIGAECCGEPLARPREARHHGSHGDSDDLADFTVRQLVELSQHDHLFQFCR